MQHYYVAKLGHASGCRTTGADHRAASGRRWIGTRVDRSRASTASTILDVSGRAARARTGDPAPAAFMRPTGAPRPRDVRRQGRSPGSRIDAPAWPSRCRAPVTVIGSGSPLTVAGAASASALRARPNSLLARDHGIARTLTVRVFPSVAGRVKAQVRSNHASANTRPPPWISRNASRTGDTIPRSGRDSMRLALGGAHVLDPPGYLSLLPARRPSSGCPPTTPPAIRTVRPWKSGAVTRLPPGSGPHPALLARPASPNARRARSISA